MSTPSGPMVSHSGWEMISLPGLNTMTGCVLAFWAGATNTVTTLAILFERSSHMSGRLTDAGMNAILNPIDALLVLTIWMSFVFGSFLAGLMLDRIGFTRSLLLVATGLGVGGLLVWKGYLVTGDYYTYGRFVIAIILPLSMGFQNSLTSLLPRIGRSTHWTGNSTDIGIALARGNYSLAFHNLAKIFSFCLGCALLAFLIGIRGVPAIYGLLLVAIGFFLTTITLCCLNRAITNA